MRRLVAAWLMHKPWFLAFDLTVACVALPLAFLLREDFELKPTQASFLAGAAPLAGLVALVALRAVGVHRTLWRYATMRDFLRVVVGSALAVLGFMAAAFLWDRLQSVPRSVPLMQWLVMTAGLCGGRVLYRALHVERTRSPDSRQVGRGVLLVGGGDAAALIAHMLSGGSSPWRLLGILDDKRPLGQVIAGTPVLGRLRDFRNVLGRLALRGLKPERVIVTAPHDELGLEAVRALQRVADTQGIPVDYLPDLLRFRGEPAPEVSVLDQPLARALDPALGRLPYFIAKRLLDILISALVLTVALPLLLAAVACSWLTIGPPTLFRQIRRGRGGAPFVMYKLRTMRDDFGSDGAPVPDAERTPWLGKFLRRTRLDELPQFWNVLIGDMSVVGPRPLIESDLVDLPENGAQRYKFRPGITGWAQVHGGRQLATRDKLTLDLWYIREASLALDVKVLLLTAQTIVCGERVNHVVVESAKIDFQTELVG